MATKTWKIGEYCKGGVLTTKVSKTKVIVICKDWDFSAGTRKSSNQSNAQEWNRLELSIDKLNTRDLSEFLYDLTSSYYVGKIMEWFESKLPIDYKLRNPMHW